MKSTINSLVSAFDRLSGREQLMLLFVVFGLLSIFVILGGFIITSDLNAKESRINAKLEKLEQLGELRSDYQRKLSEQNQLAERIKTNNQVRLLSYIEDVSKEANIELGNATERQGTTSSEILREEAAEVVVRNVSIDRLYDFLKRVEEKNNLVKIRRLKVQRRYDNPKRLDATVTVGTFKTKEGA